jgi:multidrug efflux pump subunit AcrA (membrane-fusion protein)
MTKSTPASSSRRRRWTVVLCGLVAAVALAWPKRTHGEGNSESIIIKSGNFQVACVEPGELHPVQVTTLASPTYGDIGFIVPEGTLVKKGERVFSLETRQLEDRLKQLQDEMASAQLNLAQQQQQRDLDLKRLATELAFQKDTTNLARLKEEDLLSNPKPVDKDDAANILETATVQVKSDEHSYEIAKDLYDKGFGSAGDLRTKEIAFKIATVGLKRAQIKHDTIMDGPLPYNRKKTALQRESSDLDLAVKELDIKDQTDDYGMRIRAAEHAVEAARRKLDRCRQDLERSVVRAPHDGVVVYRIVNRELNKKVEVGDKVGPWNSPVDLPNYEKMKVRTQVPESFVQHLIPRGAGLPGSTARVTVKTLPDKVYSAEVIWIDGWARDRNSKLSEADVKAQGMAGVRVFDVEVELRESDPTRLRDGFQATVEFPGEILKDVLSVPATAIVRREGGTFVQVVSDSGTEWRRVRLGEQSAIAYVIKDGLTAGEKVIAAPEVARPAEKPPEAKPETKKAAPEAPAEEQKPRKRERKS